MHPFQTIGRTSKSTAIPLPVEDNQNTQKMQTYIHAPSGNQTHDPTVEVTRESTHIMTVWLLKSTGISK